MKLHSKFASDIKASTELLAKCLVLYLQIAQTLACHPVLTSRLSSIKGGSLEVRGA